MAERRVKMSFPDDGANGKVVDNVENYLIMIIPSKPMTLFWENGQNLIFWKIVNKKVQKMGEDEFFRP